MIEIDVEARFGAFELQAKFAASGEITAIFGPSGAGKSALVRITAGLEMPAKGSIRVAGRTLFDKEKGINLPPSQRNVGYVFQDAKLFPHLSVKQNLTYARWAGRRKGILSFDDVCNVLGIETLLERMPDRLSGGERQRVAIGRALLSDPSILLLDEPLSALDMARKLEILPFLEQVRDTFGIPIIYISHSVDEVTRLADYLVVMDEGKVTSCGAIEEVLGGLDIRGSGEGLEAGSLIAGTCSGFDEQVNLAHIDVEGQILMLPISAMEVGTRVRLRIKAGDVALALTKPQGTSIQNMLECEISTLKQVGPSHVEVGLRLGDQHIRSRITRKSVMDLKLVTGGKCIALLKAVALEGRGQRPG